MASWRVAKSLLTLRDQVNAAYPDRSKENDGTIGNAAHAATNSDHNPNTDGVVTAMDITNDPAHGLISRKLAESLAASRDRRIKYLISNGEILSSKVSPWVWRPYNGTNAHREHVHISVMSDPALYDDTSAWEMEPVSTISMPRGAGRGKGSWYSQFKGRYAWRDPGDAPGSNALGVADNKQGVAFYNHDTLGTWFLVTAPNGKTLLLQQTDIGPHPRTGRLIDISARAAEAFSYGPDDFPTDGEFTWVPAMPPPGLVNLTPREQAAHYEIDTGGAQTVSGTPPAVVVPVKSAWTSKINWVAAATAIIPLLAAFGLPVTEEQKTAILAAAPVVGGVVIMVLRTFFTNSVTPSAVDKKVE